MTDLVEKIRAAIAETERIAQAAWQENWRWYAEDKTVMTHADQRGDWDGYRTTGTRDDAAHIARHDPAAVLRRCAADRKILDLHAPTVKTHQVYRNDVNTGQTRNDYHCGTCGGRDWDIEEIGEEPCDTVLALAEAYGVEEGL